MHEFARVCFWWSMYAFVVHVLWVDVCSRAGTRTRTGIYDRACRSINPLPLLSLRRTRCHDASAGAHHQKDMEQQGGRRPGLSARRQAPAVHVRGDDSASHRFCRSFKLTPTASQEQSPGISELFGVRRGRVRNVTGHGRSRVHSPRRLWINA